MATVKQYIAALRQRQDVIAVKYGCDIARADKQTRVVNLSILALLAVIVKALVDKGVITDAELTATLNAARDDVYDDEPVESPPLRPGT
jgi:hypothetical protein